MMRTTLAAGLGLLLLAACGSDPGTGRLQVVLGDAPFPFDMVESAQITVDVVQVRVDAEDDDASGWVTLSGGAGVYDLLDLQNGLTAHLVDVELPVGDVDQIRLVVEQGRVTLTDGRVFVLNVPSGSASGLKVFPQPPVRIVQDATTEVLLDVDVGQSFQSIPAAPEKVEDIDTFRFDPVLRVGNLTTGGSIAGTVYSAEGTLLNETDDLPLPGATVRAFANGDTTSTAASDDGTFQILGLAPGSWQVEGSAGGYLQSTRVVEVLAGQDTGVDLRLLELTP